MSRFKRIKILLSRHPFLMDFLFSKRDQELADDYRSKMLGNGPVLILMSKCFSHAEQILIKSAISIWNGDAEINLEECISILDEDNFASFCQAIAGTNERVLAINRGWGL